MLSPHRDEMKLSSALLVCLQWEKFGELHRVRMFFDPPWTFFYMIFTTFILKEEGSMYPHKCSNSLERPSQSGEAGWKRLSRGIRCCGIRFYNKVHIALENTSPRVFAASESLSFRFAEWNWKTKILVFAYAILIEKKSLNNTSSSVGNMHNI